MNDGRSTNSIQRWISLGRAGHSGLRRHPKSRRRRPPLSIDPLEPRQMLTVEISEFLASNQTTLADDFGEFSDWIELHNSGPSPIDLEGWSLTDDAGNLAKWRFPAATLPADGYLLVWASDRDQTDPARALHTNFRLSGGGEYLALVQPDTTTIESDYAPAFPPQSTDVSYGLSPNGSLEGYFVTPTPGVANSAPIRDSGHAVVISELMYSLPRGSLLDAEDTSLEFIELHNRGLTDIDVTGWRFTRGVDFTLPSVSIPAGGQLVVAADASAFANAYPQVPNVVGGWSGSLSNSGETIEVVDASGSLVDQLRYADEGDWSTRQPGQFDRGHRGWIWSSRHDGGGMSLELVNVNMPNDSGQNWKESTDKGGSPGEINSVATSNAPPIIADVVHDPPLPRSTQSVQVAARILDESMEGITARVYWRADGEGDFLESPMNDDGLSGDAAAGDGVFSATLPAQSNRTVVEFYVHADDATGLARTAPAPTSTGAQQTNALYQVFDGFDADAPWVPGSAPIYHVIMTPAERSEFDDINRQSNAQFNSTFIAITGTGIEVRYNAATRVRGSGSRSDTIPNNRIRIPRDNPWQGVTRINLNQRNPINQISGSALFRLAGIPAADAHAVRVFSNGVDLKNGGFYIHAEALDAEYAENHFPADPNGNLYRGRRPNESPFPNDAKGAGLRYFGPDPLPYVSYDKSTNASEADWSDVINLTHRLNNSSESEYVESVREVVNVEQWFRTIAMNSLIGNTEYGLFTGDPLGDDYAMYRGIDDIRFQMVPYDWDSLYSNVGATIFPTSQVVPLNRLIRHPEFLPEYYAQYLDLIDNVLLTDEASVLLDQSLRHVASESRIANIKGFLASRADRVRGQINTLLTATADLPRVDDVLRSTERSVILFGTYPQADTRSVRIESELTTLDGRGNWEYLPFDADAEALVDLGSTWRYLDDGSDLGTTWRQAEFDDGDWSEGRAQLGYGDGDEVTTIGFGGDPDDRFVTSYFRTDFQIDDPTQYGGLSLRMVYDDGAAVYLNGTEVAREGLPSDAGADTLATQFRGASVENEVVTIVLPLDTVNLLVPGKNVVAVEVHQNQPDSPDAGFDLALDAASTSGRVVDLARGMNRLTVAAFDNSSGIGMPTDESSIDVWYDGGGETLVTGTLDGVNTWTGEQGPYRIRGDVIVDAQAVLNIGAGTTVFFEEGAKLTIHGQLIATGSAEAPIWFTRRPGEQRWNGLQFESSQHDNRIEHAIIQYGITDGGMIGLTDSKLSIAHSTLDHTDLRRIRSINSSLVVQDSTFTDIFEPDEAPTTDNRSEHIWGRGIPEGGQWLVSGNVFGTITGHNDAIDFDAPRNQGRYAQIRDNQFLGGGDDALDMTGDVWIQGNVFRNYKKDSFNVDPGQSNVISSSSGEFWAIANVFENVQHAALVKENAFMHFLNNTVIDSEFAPLYFDLPGQTSGPGRGARVEGSLFANSGATFAQIQEDTELDVHFSFLPTVDEGRIQGLLNHFGDPHVGGAEVDYALLPGSPAQGVGPNRSDMGARVPAGATLFGIPEPITNVTATTLFVGGAGLTEYRFQLDDGPVSPPQPIGQPIQLAGLGNGDHHVSVWGRNVLGQWQVEPTVSDSWFVASDITSTVRINEILADNSSAHPQGNVFTDAVELYNFGGARVDLSGFSLTDRPDQPKRFVFPQGSQIEGGQYLVVAADPQQNVSGLNLGFGFDRRGDALYLFSPGGAMLDSVSFGNQLTDLSIGRMGRDSNWTLTAPSLGESNLPTRLGDSAQLSINEWYASGRVRLTQDRIELYNGHPYPVDLSGFSLTDEPHDIPRMSPLPELSFIGGKGHATWIADGDPQDGPDHLSFRLSAVHDHLALFDAGGQKLDEVFYYGQTDEFSQGRAPDGASRYAFLPFPSFGARNGDGLNNLGSVVKLDWDAVWKYEASGSNLGTEWRERDYDDSQWLSGAGPLGQENEPLPEPIRTSFDIGGTTFYFRTTVQLDTDPSDVMFQATTLLDDGAIIYVNGQEVLRIGMPDGDVNFNTIADRVVNEASLEGLFAIASDAWVRGENVIAVEAHQINAGSSDLVFGLQLDGIGEIIDQVAGDAQRLVDDLRITEVMYHPSSSDQPEFIELKNVGELKLNLGGVRLATGVNFTFPIGTELAPNEIVVLTDDLVKFRQTYGHRIDVAGQYTGQLNNGGEEIALLLAEPIDTAILRFDYESEWFVETDGLGASLSITDARLDFRAWGRASSWEPTTPTPGRDPGDALPGDLNRDGVESTADIDRLCSAIHDAEAGFDLNGDGQINSIDLEFFVRSVLQSTFGDANLDGIFDSTDIVQIFVAGEYEDGITGNSTWSEGDWNCDEEFGSDDLVQAFAWGGYESGSPAVASLSLAVAPVSSAVASLSPAVAPTSSPVASVTPDSESTRKRPLRLEPQTTATVWAESTWNAHELGNTASETNDDTWLDELARDTAQKGAQRGEAGPSLLRDGS